MKFLTAFFLLVFCDTVHANDLIGKWVADNTQIKFIPNQQAVDMVLLALEGEIDGTFTINGDSTIDAKYILAMKVSMVILVPVELYTTQIHNYTGQYLKTPRSIDIETNSGDLLHYEYEVRQDSLFIFSQVSVSDMLVADFNLRGFSELAELLKRDIFSQFPNKEVVVDFVTIFTQIQHLAGDFDGDNDVDISDFLLFVDHYGYVQGDRGYKPRYDLDGNGAIGVSDFLLFVDYYGQTDS